MNNTASTEVNTKDSAHIDASDNVTEEEFISGLFNSPFYLMQCAEFKTLFEKYPLWGFYTFEEIPCRVIQLHFNNEKFEFYIYCLNADNYQVITAENFDKIIRVNNWSPQHMKKIKKFYLPSIFTTKLGYIKLLNLI